MKSMDPLLGLAVIAFALSLVAEWRRHKYNYDFLTFAGGEERIPRTMRFYYGAISGSNPPKHLQVFGGLLLMLGLGLKLWTFQVLGRLWSMRCIFLPGIAAVYRGPYRFMKNPEYLARTCEVLGLALIAGAYCSAALGVIFSIVMVSHIVEVEQQQLRELSGPQ
jgi:protein-S-isoprenylcysteine O-methyltransferase Ste14